jgi:alpha-ketoglutarate-dependent sulfate ester dioxygenase
MTDLLEKTVLDVRPVAGQIGAEIHGLDIARPLDDATVAAIRDALLHHRVVFFRGQSLDHATQIRFGRYFGELTYAHPHDDSPPDGFPEIYTVDVKRFVERYGEPRPNRASYNGRIGWHSDVTPAINPPFGSILRADVVPEIGGDTTWTNLVAAYEALSGPLQRLADTLWAEHRYGAGFTRSGRVPSERQRERYELLVAHHPVVRVHPETGEKALYVNPGFTSHILDVSTDESDRLLDLFFEQVTRPEHTVRFRWQPGDVAFWDNRTTAHQAPRDIEEDTPRTLHRVTLIGDVPVGPEGRESRLIAGEAFRTIPPVPFTTQEAN